MCESGCVHVGEPVPMSQNVFSVTLYECLCVLEVRAHPRRWICLSTWVDMPWYVSFCPALRYREGQGQTVCTPYTPADLQGSEEGLHTAS